MIDATSRAESGAGERYGRGAPDGWAARARARFLLRRADRLGAEPRVVGRPLVRNMGRLEVGARFLLSGLPIRSHLITWPGATLSIGDDVVVSHGVALAVQRRVEIGDGARIGPFVMIMDTHFHRPGDWKDAKPRLEPVRIGARAVIGAGAVILPGADVDADARIAPGSVVSGRVLAGAEIAGVPARPPARRGPRPGGIGDRVASALVDSFHLSAAPEATAGRRSVPGWSALGGLRLLVALEEEFDVALDALEFAGIERVGELPALVERGLARRGLD